LEHNRAKNINLEGIIADIHRLRFNPAKPYIISGDHFSVLYPRNLGTFYLPMVDPHIALNSQDWENRQQIYLQSTAYALEVFAKVGRPFTTLVPVSIHSVTPINIYSYPSDALYGILFALKAMQTSEDLYTIYPFTTSLTYPLQTIQASQMLVKTYRTDLKTLLLHYKNKVYNESTGLIRKYIHISSAKDITKRQSAFYDNVILWKTLKLAADLGIQEVDNQELYDYKKRIIATYWYEEGGYFLEDISDEGKQHHYYSSDWLVALFTGFLDPKNPQERVYFERSVAYIQKERIDQPFGLKYQQSDRKSRQIAVVRWAVAEYGGTAIWSFWGNEYIKLLLILYQQTGNLQYLRTAEYQLKAYQDNIIRYRGFPEVYDKNGDMLQTLIYKSVIQTGWVVNFEQAKMMYENR
jgi:hypothetical protein